MHRTPIRGPGGSEGAPGHARQQQTRALSSLHNVAFARTRLYRLGVIAATATSIYYPIWIVANDVVSRGRGVIVPVIAVFVFSLALDLGLVFLSTRTHVTERVQQHLVSIYLVLRCAMLSLDPVLLDGLLGMPAPRMAFTCVAAVMFPMLVPASPSRLAVPVTLALATQPLAVWLFAVPPFGDALVNSALTAVLSGGLSFFASRVTWGLRVTAAHAREVGAYELVSRLGAGSMGEVWRGKHRLLARAAAIKLMPYNRHDAEYRSAVRQFEREAKITASLTSPHTVTLFDYGMTEFGAVYYVMELCEGRDLQALVELHGALSPAETIDVALQICESLGEAHQKGLVHRDLKPANVMRCEAGRRKDFVKVLDFGLAQLARRLGHADSTPQSTVTHVAGTPAYMPPEVARGDAVDHRADLYQLGCVMYFLLTGRLVFEFESPVAVALAHVHTPPQHLADVTDQAVPAALEDIVQRCLAKHPDDRFQTVEELEVALQAALDEPEADRRNGVRHPDALTEH